LIDFKRFETEIVTGIFKSNLNKLFNNDEKIKELEEGNTVNCKCTVPDPDVIYKMNIFKDIINRVSTKLVADAGYEKTGIGIKGVKNKNIDIVIKIHKKVNHIIPTQEEIEQKALDKIYHRSTYVPKKGNTRPQIERTYNLFK
jgi:hypothetical protein